MAHGPPPGPSRLLPPVFWPLGALVPAALAADGVCNWWGAQRVAVYAILSPGFAFA